MTNFDDIRPYNDEEVRPILDRVLADSDFQAALARLSFPRLGKWLPGLIGPCVSGYARRQLRGINSVADLQAVVQGYMAKMIRRTTEGVTCSGLEHLNPAKAHLFVSNHRDIAMDPAFVDWVLYQNGYATPRLAIGDNLLTMSYASDLMRLNKSFIVNRSAKGNKEKFRALKHLSAYLYHSLIEDKSHIWIAQRQGRAKDGWDRTETAVIKMFAMNRPKDQSFVDYVRELSIVPVSISYEWDPLDEYKARELYEQDKFGHYEKGEHEDVFNIARGIAGVKGQVHLAFGPEMDQGFENAEELAAELDRHIVQNYVLQPSNCFAYKALYGDLPPVVVGREGFSFDEKRFKTQARLFTERLRAIDPKYRPWVRQMYANPIVSKLELQAPQQPARDDLQRLA